MTTAPRLKDVVAALEAAYPPRLALDWDAVGLVCGDPDDEVDKALVCVDVTEAVVDEALAAGAKLIVAHHPLLLRGVSSVSADTPKGRLVHRLIRAGCALFTAHTNADRADPGVSDALAEALGLRVLGPVEPVTGPELDKWVVLVPLAEADRVRSALFAAGAGRLGDYDQCSWSADGIGQFRPLAGANPAIGRTGELEQVEETRIEVIAPKSLRAAVLAALRTAHPYEEPAFDVFAQARLPTSLGLGRIGALARPVPLGDFLARAAAALPFAPEGLRATGDPDSPVETVAVCGGAGDSLLGAVAKAGVDVYVTGDLRHHPVDEHVRAHRTALVDVGHWASERPWCDQAAGVLGKVFSGRVEAVPATTAPGPWSQHVGTTTTG
ncbi:Nif3-like dinuclear metal center hexameric protein [Segniliparus rugosus]|uniref:GTP cyclohydrolase 1 type 2 homolog n=1 Tax=Segniliparus rugosus (strain ATCC BAA-974 / DSM 45345 / CCUG 50838 / CIP 108380 / JCM 13579 / CDC 945) TaxID=679197 RepID=E5XRG0_SEGRC|nr:Nif3-like dinuclear metal center hexameric protein [Segniliparus rugosus]EFV13062.1 YbgI/family dinuclear metal center protein [Segniliparus rugosus ATCC BAA-974]